MFLAVSTRVPALFARFVDDAAVFPPGSAPLPQAVTDHRRHRAAWYADLVGPLLVPVSDLGKLAGMTEARGLAIGLVGDTGVAGLRQATFPTDQAVVQVEVAVAKRGEDPQPDLVRLIELTRHHPGLVAYAEIPLSWGLLAALDTVAAARAEGLRIAAKFRTGGLAAELFPTPVELAAVICACRERELPFKLTAGLHHAIRQTDPETGFVHHGFLNVLVATAAAASGTDVADVAPILAGTDPVPLIEAARRILHEERPLWTGFGSCSVPEPLADLSQLGLL
jgi:hypothetical protein